MPAPAEQDCRRTSAKARSILTPLEHFEAPDGRVPEGDDAHQAALESDVVKSDPAGRAQSRIGSGPDGCYFPIHDAAENSGRNGSVLARGEGV